MIIFIKKLSKLTLISINRFFKSKFFTIKFLFKGVIVKKPLHINIIKNVKIGKNTTIYDNCRLDCYKTKNQRMPIIEIGNRVMIGFNFTGLSNSKLLIGDDCLIASNVFISTENHGMEPGKEKYINQELITKDVIIENNCWIGEKVIILPGVTIGEWSIIGAGSIVTKNIPPYCMAAGNPAKIIKKYNLENKKWEIYE